MSGRPLQILSPRMGYLWDALVRAYTVLGFEDAAGGDEVFRALVLARIIEPVSKLDSLRVLGEVGVPAPSYSTVKRRLPGFAKPEFRKALAGACATRAGLGPATLVLYDLTTLYFETDKADGFRESGFSKERRLEPQITLGMLTDASGFPLMVNAFEGNKAETQTMLPVIEAFMTAHALKDVTVVADAGMISEANRHALEDAGLTFILGAKIPIVPYQVEVWRKAHPEQEIPDGHVFTQPMPPGPKQRAKGRKDQTIFYQYKADRARRTLRGITEQVAKAEKAVAGKVPVKRNRFIRLQGGTRSVNRDLEAKARELAGLKGYWTNLPDPDPDFVIGAYHHLFHVEAAFRMAKTDLAARPIYHHLPGCPSRSSSPRSAGTAPSRSPPGPTPSPPRTPCPPPAPHSSAGSPPQLCTKRMSQLRPYDPGVDRLDRVRGAHDPADLLVELQERHELGPRVGPQLHDHRVLPTPFLGEL